MIPATTKALAHARQPFPSKPSVWPLRDSEGRTWAERAEMRKKERAA